jgi:hypothetical protein
MFGWDVRVEQASGDVVVFERDDAGPTTFEAARFSGSWAQVRAWLWCLLHLKLG